VPQRASPAASRRSCRTLGFPGADMKTETLCKLLLDEVSKGSIPFYEGMLSTTPIDAIHDPQWKAIVLLARRLPEADRKVIISFARQAAVDSLATIFGAIDGITSLDDEYASLFLTDGDGQEHSGALQETLLRLAKARGW